MRAHAVGTSFERVDALDVDGQRAIDPSAKRAGVTDGVIVTTRQDGDTGIGGGRTIEHAIGQAAARVAGDDDVVMTEGDVVE